MSYYQSIDNDDNNVIIQDMNMNINHIEIKTNLSRIKNFKVMGLMYTITFCTTFFIVFDILYKYIYEKFYIYGYVRPNDFMHDMCQMDRAIRRLDEKDTCNPFIVTLGGAILGAGTMAVVLFYLGLTARGPVAGSFFAMSQAAGLVAAGSSLAIIQSATMTGASYSAAAAITSAITTAIACYKVK